MGVAKDLVTDQRERGGVALTRQGRLRALLDANQLLTGDLAAPVLLQRIVEAAGELVGAHYAVLGVIAPDGTSFNFVHTGPTEEAGGRVGLDLAVGDDQAGTPVDDARPFRPCLDPRHADRGPCGLPEGHPPVNTLLSLPIQVGAERLGNLYISRTSRQRFNAEEEELAAALAAIAGLAIRNGRLHRAALTRAEWMRAAAMVTHGALSATEHPLQLIVEQLAQVAAADLVTVLFPTADDRELVADLVVGIDAKNFTGARLPIEGTLAGAAYRGGKPRTADADDLTSLGGPFGGRMGLGPVMVLPLVGSSGVRGLLAVARLQSRASFSDDDLEMASAFAIQAAVSIELAEVRAAERGPLPAAAPYGPPVAQEVPVEPTAGGWATQRLVLRQITADLRPSSDADRIAAVIAHLDESVNTFQPRQSTAVEALSDAHATLAARAAELVQANADLQEFAAIAAHDLRSPLLCVAGFTDLLATAAPDLANDEKAVELLDMIRGAAQDGLGLVTDLLSRARLTAAPPRPEPVDLGALARSVAAEFISRTPGAEVEVGALPVIAGDRTQVRQLFTNLIGNGVKFVPPGREPLVRITAHVAENPSQVHIRVLDNGVGIRAEDRTRVFVMFERGGAYAAATYPGTGVGLAICQRVVERHGGRIWIEESPSGGGTCIAFTLPLQAVP